MNQKPELSNLEINSMLSRRSLLQTASCGFGYMALLGMCGEAAARDDTYKNPLAVRPSHFKASAKRVIFLFMPGGPHRWTPSTTSPSFRRVTARRPARDP